jgi:hypothetical protein
LGIKTLTSWTALVLIWETATGAGPGSILQPDEGACQISFQGRFPLGRKTGQRLSPSFEGQRDAEAGSFALVQIEDLDAIRSRGVGVEVGLRADAGQLDLVASGLLVGGEQLVHAPGKGGQGVRNRRRVEDRVEPDFNRPIQLLQRRQGAVRQDRQLRARWFGADRRAAVRGTVQPDPAEENACQKEDQRQDGGLNAGFRARAPCGGPIRLIRQYVCHAECFVL